MKKIFCILLVWGYALCAGKAQVSEGGTPYSFGSNFRLSKSASLPLPAYTAPALDMAQVRLQDMNPENGNRFAVATFVDIDTKQGLWQDLPTGDRLWRVQINLPTPEAFGTRLFFDDFYVPQAGKVYIYSLDRQILLGAFTAQNNKPHHTFATTLIEAKEVIIEYLEPAHARGQARLHIHRIDQAYRRNYQTPTPRFEKSALSPEVLGFGYSGSCNLNVNCTSLANDWQDEKRGIVRILVTSSVGSSFCSGSLIGNTAQDSKPYILTAHHCLRNTNASHLNLWTFDFNYEITNCNATTIEPANTQNITGSTLRASYADSDFALLELQQNVPASFNAKWNSWDRSGNDLAGAVCIHHPSGDTKKFTIDTDLNSTTSYYDDLPNNNTYYKQIWNNGTTEGGSSGSPLFSTAGNIIGQLRGGEASCGAPNAPDWFGKVYVSWTGGGTPATRLSDWLDPIGSGAVMLTSLSERIGGKPFRIYPNPTSQIPRLAYPQAVWAGKVVDIYAHTIEGKRAYHTQTTLPAHTDSLPLDVRLAKGVYIISIHTSAGIFTEKLIVL